MTPIGSQVTTQGRGQKLVLHQGLLLIISATSQSQIIQRFPRPFLTSHMYEASNLPDERSLR